MTFWGWRRKPRLRGFSYQIAKTFYPWGKEEPVDQQFVISFLAVNGVDAQQKAAMIGKGLGLLLKGPI